RRVSGPRSAARDNRHTPGVPLPPAENRCAGPASGAHSQTSWGTPVGQPGGAVREPVRAMPAPWIPFPPSSHPCVMRAVLRACGDPPAPRSQRRVRKTTPVCHSLLLRRITWLDVLINRLPGNVYAVITRRRGHGVVGTGNRLSVGHVTETLDHSNVHAGP